MAYPTYFPYQSPQSYYQPQMTNYPAQMPQTPQQAQTGGVAYSCRPVTSREEAVAAQVDFFGPGTLMPDLGHGVIYLKRFNQNTGACDMMTFSLELPRQEELPEYATIEDLNKLRDEFIRAGKGGKKNDADE